MIFGNFVIVLILFFAMSFYSYVLFQHVVELRRENSVILTRLAAVTDLVEQQRQSLQAQQQQPLPVPPPPSPVPSLEPRRCEQETPYRIAFLMPYIESQTDKLLDAMSNWRQHLPFDAALDNVRHACDLVFYYHKSRELHETKYGASRQLILDSVRAATNDSRNNFLPENVHFMYADLSDEDDRYPEGANHMFYNLFINATTFNALSSKYKYFFYMEPDVYPIRQYWANKVYNESAASSSTFWMKGSQFHGRYLPIHFRFHINGNAIYGLGDRKFPEILLEVKNAFSLRMGYDNNIFQYLMNEARYQMYYDHWHQFVFSDFIRNLHWTDYSLKHHIEHFPNTFLIHGGNNTDTFNKVTRYTNLPDDYGKRN